MKIWPIMISIGSALIIVGSLWIMGLMIFIHLIPLTSPSLITPTEGIVVFTGGEGRLTTALSLFQEGKGKYLLISGVNPRSTLPDTIAHIPHRDRITLGYEALDTPGNADETAVWVRTHHIKTLRLITSSYHMLRSLFELRRLLPDVEMIPYCVVSKRLKNHQWWRDRTTLMMVLQEYNKLLFALIGRPFEDMHSYFSPQETPQ